MTVTSALHWSQGVSREKARVPGCVAPLGLGETSACPALSGGKGTRLALEAINTEQLVNDFIAG